MYYYNDGHAAKEDGESIVTRTMREREEEKVWTKNIHTRKRKTYKKETQDGADVTG